LIQTTIRIEIQITLEWWSGLVTLAIIVASSLLAKPVVDVGGIFAGLQAIIAQMANIPIDLACHL
jgi:hypothetical protein